MNYDRDLNWRIRIKKGRRTIREFSGNKLPISCKWDGKNKRGKLVKPGKYKYEISAWIEDEAGKKIVSAKKVSGEVTLIRVKIKSPKGNKGTSLGPKEDPTEIKIPFKAIIKPSPSELGVDPDIDWTVKLEYESSGGVKCGGFPVIKTFKTKHDKEKKIKFTKEGGRLTINAQITIEGTICKAEEIYHFIVGDKIADEKITPLFVAEYDEPPGGTPRLMTGLCVTESSYRQFRIMVLFGHKGKWPIESPTIPSGKYIGLMQVPMEKDTAWNWRHNIRRGASIFEQKMVSVDRYIRRERQKHPELRDLTGREREESAVALYKGYKPGPDGKGRYWHTVESPDGTWIWIRREDIRKEIEKVWKKMK